jgi:hypothetical protein
LIARIDQIGDLVCPLSPLSEVAVLGGMHSPGHMVDAPEVGTSAMLLLLLLSFLWRNFLPSFDLFLFDTIAFVLFVFVFLTLLLLVSLFCHSGKLGRQL